MSGFEELRAMIERVDNLKGFAKEAAPEVADVVEAEIKANIKAARDPYGKAWELTKEGEKPLQNAGDELFVAPVGTRVLARLKGPAARHNNRRARGGILRQILPGKRIPNDMKRAITRVLVKQFNETIGGGQ